MSAAKCGACMWPGGPACWRDAGHAGDHVEAVKGWQWPVGESAESLFHRFGPNAGPSLIGLIVESLGPKARRS